MRAVFDFDLLDHSDIWVPASIMAIILTLFVFLTSKEFRHRLSENYVSLLFVFVFSFTYGYGTIVMTNCYYDKGEAEIYDAEIIEKWADSGKITTYHFKITPWSDREEEEDVTVDYEMYELLEVGDPIRVQVMPGTYGIPWFFIIE